MGTWDTLEQTSQVAAVHAALLPTAEVVYYSGNTGPLIPAQVRVWNPATGEVRTPPNEPETDLFCSGHALLPDGRLFVAGGTAHYSTGPGDPWGGSKAAYIFDPNTGWERVADMSYGRWYPTVIRLPDGRMMVAGGDDNGWPTEPIEIFDPAAGWQVLPTSADRIMPLYPRLHVLPTGEVACAGQGAATAILDLMTYEWREVWPAAVGGGSGVDERRESGGAHQPMEPMQPMQPMGQDEPDEPESRPVFVGPHHHPPGSAGPRPDDLSVLLPPAHFGKVLNAGGGNPVATDVARVISLLDGAPEWRTIAPMHFPRWFPNSAILPNGKLLVVGGGRFYNADPVMEAEIFDPETETWTVDSAMNVPRLYHSTALLLPDGRVWVAGTDGEYRMELYSPDYLATGARPVLWAAPASVTYNQGFPIPMADAESVGSVCFIRLGSVTHAFNTEQRHVPLHFEVTGPQEIVITAPPDQNVAPPGHYMLFVRTWEGVPAEAPIVNLVALPAEPPQVIEEPGIDEVGLEEPIAIGEPAADDAGPGSYSTDDIAAALRKMLELQTLDEVRAQLEQLAAELEQHGMGGGEVT
ncbi:MAG TPA: galactose oxidase-like domain-containing protein [Chloroflexota bacterium]|nr:galactose oxidase-like domain-containing protein [Chloroflexota bacterium]